MIPSDRMIGMSKLQIMVSDAVFAWPEYRAFAQRLGLPIDLPFMEVTITLSMGKAVSIALACRGRDSGPDDEAAELAARR